MKILSRNTNRMDLVTSLLIRGIQMEEISTTWLAERMG
jgi:hypothetical protein